MNYLSYLVLILYNIQQVVCYVRYDNHSLLAALPGNNEQFTFLQTIVDEYNVNIWKGPMVPFTTKQVIQFSIGPDQLDRFLNDASKLGLNVFGIIQNIQSYFDAQKTNLKYYRRHKHSFDWHNYYRYQDIKAWMKDFSRAHTSEIKIIKIGKSHEKRDILAMRINLSKGPKEKPKVIMDGGMHGREWLSPAVVTYIMYHIYNAKDGRDNDLKKIAENHDWYFVPLVNPDGYEYAHTVDRLWKKNRRGKGVDLSKNFDSGFALYECDMKESSDEFCGKAPFSEPETNALQNFIRIHSNNLMYYLSFRAYGQTMIIPFSHSPKHLSNYEQVLFVAQKAANKIRSTLDTKYNVGTHFDVLGYLSSGDSAGWVKKTFNCPFALTISLRDVITYGYALPQNQITPTAEEILDGIKEMMIPESKVYLKEIKSSTVEESTSAGMKLYPIFYLYFFIYILLFLVFCKNYN